ncbi:hypothetical protein CK203_083693 [Vitis vinifera]|uniref:Reverse transcriptase zinc-binding domain-containing protein n=1 Tax=Vitis vinifera TaxID=29760 RepID=A0A438CYJ6_VITVI|nr:hypothetical protein CK203_083693 [Vitis vinifera]
MIVLVNDTPTEFFSTFRGLRQEDPLSPYLFVLMMEAFSNLISRVEEKGFIRGFKDVDRAAAVFGCKVGNLPTTYLGSFGGERKIHLVRWAVICKDKRHEGLSLRHLKVFNHALLGKWLWRFPLERESFWRKVIVAKFGEEKGGWTTREVRESYGTGLGKTLERVGRSSFLELVIVLEMVDAQDFVADLWGRQGDGGGGWEVQFRKSFQDWELEEVTHFLDYISAVKVQEGEDSLVWKIERRRKFNVKSYYRSLKDENSPLFPAKEVWGSYAPLRTRLFAWKAVWGKISTGGVGVPDFSEKFAYRMEN